MKMAKRQDNIEKSTEVNAIICLNCGDTIYSRARHDFHSCTCGKVSIDGGFDYIKISWHTGNPQPVTKKITVNFSKEEIFQDWNKGIDKLGTIKKEKK